MAPPKKPTVLELAIAALMLAPNPREVDGPPVYWSWYDGPRAEALRAAKQEAAP